MIDAGKELQPINQQGLEVRSTPREEMDLFPLDTFAYEFPGREIKIDFEITEFTAICPFSDFPTSPPFVWSMFHISGALNLRA